MNPTIDKDQTTDALTSVPGKQSGGGGSSTPKNSMGRMEKVAWWILVFFSATWVFLPEPSDAVPIVGWLDEALALYLLATALDRLGIHIPILHRYLSNRTGVGKDGAKGKGKVSGRAPHEKDVTPP